MWRNQQCGKYGSEIGAVPRPACRGDGSIMAGGMAWRIVMAIMA